MTDLAHPVRIGNYRWRIVAMLFFATTINYIDRNVFSLVMIDPGFKEHLVSWAAEGGRIDSRPQIAAWVDRTESRAVLVQAPVIAALTNEKDYRKKNAIAADAKLTTEQELDFIQKMPADIRAQVLAVAPIKTLETNHTDESGALLDARHAVVAVNSWLKNAFSMIDFAFKAGYALGFLFVGSFLDRIGVRIGMASALILWSVSSLAHTICRPLWSFCFARLTLGVGESGNFPGAVKATAEWFPKKERALANGLFNAGANVGIIIVYAFIPYILTHFGWQYAFLMTATFQCLWLYYWFRIYRSPEATPALSATELAHIRSDPPEPSARVPWLRLLRLRQTWAFAVGKLLCDPVWYFYLVWLPTFFSENNSFGDQKIDVKSITIPFLIIYIVSDLGSIAGGWLSSTLMKKGWSANRARKTTMLICACAITPIFIVAQTGNMWLAVALVALGAAAHQANSTTLFSLVGDMFPRHAIASVVGIGGMFGALSGALVALFTGWIIINFGYQAMFIYAASAYLLGLLIIHVLVPKLDPVTAT